MPSGRTSLSRKAGTVATAATLALAATLCIACSCTSDDGDDDASNANDGTTATSEPTTTTVSVEEEVEAAYLAYREMVTRLLESPNPDDPEIMERAAEQNRGFLVDRLTTLEAAGHALRFGANHRFAVASVTVTGEQAVVHDCTVDDASTVVVATGEVVSQSTSTELLQAELIRDSAVWKVRTIESLGQWAGITSCEQ